MIRHIRFLVYTYIIPFSYANFNLLFIECMNRYVGVIYADL